MNSKSLENLENDYWDDLHEYPSELVKRCYKYRKIPLVDLTIEQIRTLISQKIGLKFLLKIALQKLKQDVLAEGDFYQGDLLEVTSKIPYEFWKTHPTELQTLREIVSSKSEVIKIEIGEKQFDRLMERIK